MISATLGTLISTRLSAGAADPVELSSASLFQGVRKKIDYAIATGEATGVAVAVIQGGRIVWEEGFGWADREAGLNVTPHTPFSMASITKPFTTTTLMTLVAAGRLSLDGSANEFLARSKIFCENGNPAAATVRMLGAHVSGLPGMYEPYEAAESSLIPSPDVLLKDYGRLAYPPGSVYEYSNLGYAALNAIALSLTQIEFGALMRDRVLLPLGLKDSFFGSDAKRVPSGALPYDPLGRALPHYRTSTPASGELYASAHDLAQFLLFNLGHHVGHGAPILGRQEIAELHRPVFRGPSGIATTFGWFQGHTVSGVPFFFKSGGDPGVANRMCFVPSKDLACVVVTNQSNATPLAYGVCDEVMQSGLRDWIQPVEDCGFPATPMVDAARFAGQWYGSLQNDEVDVPIHLQLQSAQAATLAIGNQSAEPLERISAEGEALTGLTNGYIASPDVLRTGARSLEIKLLRKDNELVGRVFAVSGDPNVKNARLPYVLNLRKR
ncbi:serine hydrolase domain-containing protein [Terriglobus aquaticus]|uniref:Serine hydrolase domain-containing protein n=1 Tax=Terriglobus aquaticus TaxID=940139 RepID=A0ABW9KNC6_9BACT|nr:serine hydrolase domain-containing protein [Terriglobus aquaticus]